MHPRNVFKIRPPNYEELAKKYSSIRAKCFIGAGGKVCLDFNDLEAIRLINEILLLEYFEIDVKISPNVLVPRIPQKLNYILLIEDLINQNNLQNDQICGLDIGTGTSCIYPILGAVLNQWEFVGTDILENSIQKAAENVKRNSLENSIDLFLNKQKDSIFKGLFSVDKYSSKNFTFSMCNPPFFDPQEGEEKFIKGNKSSYQNIENMNTKRGPPSSVTTALEEEIFFQGGELCFVQQMIEESQQFPRKILIYTTMIGKLASLKKLKRILEEKQIKYMDYKLSQGRTQRYINRVGFGMAKEPKNYEVLVYEGFTCDPQKAKKVNSNQLAELFPDLFKKVSQQEENIGDIPLEDVLNCRRFLPIPLHIYLKQYLESKTPKQFAKELKSIIDAMMANKNEERFEQYLDVALQLLDVFYANSSEEDQLKLIPRFKQMENQIQKLIKLSEWFTKDFSELKSIMEAPSGKPYADCFIETKRLKKY